MSAVFVRDGGNFNHDPHLRPTQIVIPVTERTAPLGIWFSRFGATDMSATGWTSSIVPFGADQTVYIVVDSFSANGAAYRESEVERIDLESVIDDFLTGQFNDPVRVIAFNTLEHWSDDVSKDVAAEIRSRCDVNGVGAPDHISDFLMRYLEPDSQRCLRVG